jgi:hypothetical protein
MIQRSLKEAQIQEEVYRVTQRSLEEAWIHKKCNVMQRSLEEAHVHEELQHMTKIFGGGSHV